MTIREKSDIRFAVEKLEGGFDEIWNDPNDIGGKTRAGLASRYYPNLDLESLTHDEIIQIYYDDYYKHVLRIDNNVIKSYAFMTGLNIGMKTMFSYIQKTINHFNNLNDIDEIETDGIIGPITNSTLDNVINQFGIDHFILKLNDNIYYHYSTRRTAKHHFLGWYNRIYKTCKYLEDLYGI